MEHLDLAAGLLTTPAPWSMSAFDQQDAAYLSTSRQILEPIMEETSDDEEHAQNSWSQRPDGDGGSVCSSAESETGSVIRLQVTKDLDSISERDLLCPAKRTKRFEEQQQPSSLEDAVLLRRQQFGEANSLERFLTVDSCARDSWGASSVQRSSLGSRRFDDFYADSDSLSYHSLSRSSSLIQFESLERQLMLQEQHVSMSNLGNSSPSLLSFDVSSAEEKGARSAGNSDLNSGSNSRRGSQSSLLKRYESTDGRLHQTYYDLDKLNLDADAGRESGFGVSAKLAANIAEPKSDSESSTSSFSSVGGRSILLAAAKSGAKDASDADLAGAPDKRQSVRMTAFQQRGGKNSAENLSEDSGYCEPSTCASLGRAESKGELKNFEKLCEEDEECQPPLYAGYEVDGAAAVAHDARHSQITTLHRFSGGESKIDRCAFGADANVTFGSGEATATVELGRTPFAEPTTQQMPSMPSVAEFKNSRADESPSAHEEARRHHSLAHCAWPVSSSEVAAARCTTSAKACASAASCATRPRSFDVGERRPSSLPDIREALRSVGSHFGAEQTTDELDGFVLEHRCTARGSPSSSDGTGGHEPTALGAESTLEQIRKYWSLLRWHSSGSGSGSDSGVPSVPSELCKLERKKRQKHTKKLWRHSVDLDHNRTEIGDRAEGDDRLSSSAQLEAGCDSGWPEPEQQHSRIEDSAEEFPVVRSASQVLANAVALGCLSASFENLTLLDCNDFDPQSYEDCKHSYAIMGEPRRSEDSETALICKGNFLLDELSEHFDKTASILNDKPFDGTDGRCGPQPSAPPRSHKRSSANYSDTEEGQEGSEEVVVVQHVKLQIRKPTGRQQQQQHGRQSDATNSLTSEVTVQVPMPTLRKTFDQDPTNLRTNYAQSLEKCNFDPREISMSDLSDVRTIPKRRFRTHSAAAKKNSLVSSTPNLNAYDSSRGDEIEDDMCVSSAHTSMHQLPQSSAQKPLGILLPVGSRTSFGKEVSFSPVVSKYSWQEQLSEECNEPATPGADADHGQESDDELLDNADVTVLLNTKENEFIGARREGEAAAVRAAECVEEKCITISGQFEREQRPERGGEQSESGRAGVVKEIASEKSHENDVGQKQVSSPTQMTATSAVSARATGGASGAGAGAGGDLQSASCDGAISQRIPRDLTDSTPSVSGDSGNEETEKSPSLGPAEKEREKEGATTRPFSIQLPVLSEPPINRAHHILYASHQTLDSFKERERQAADRDTIGEGQAKGEGLVRVKSASAANIGPMSSPTATGAAAANAGTAAAKPYNNNNELVKSKFKADEKHPSAKSFLSRFAHGFRFSLRRHRKKQPSPQQSEQHSSEAKGDHEEGQTRASNGSAKGPSSQDFIYIPLKGPLPPRNLPQQAGNTAPPSNAGSYSSRTEFGEKGRGRVGGNGSEQSMTADAQKVTGKPPIPNKQLRGQCAVAQQQPLIAVGMSRFYGSAAAAASLPPARGRSADTDFLNAERSSSGYSQSNTGIQSSDCVATASVGVGGEPAKFTSPSASASASAAAASRKDQTTSRLEWGGAAASRELSPMAETSNKIGLIETNLDTHETVISGKTRSLLNIRPSKEHQQQQLSRRPFVDSKRSNVTQGDGADDGVAPSRDGGVLVKTSPPAGGSTAQIVSVRRPHKSMEFLLDKENQKNVLPPENELQKSHDRNPSALSEHQLRVQDSLQKLNIPDWYRQYGQDAIRSTEGGGGKVGNFSRKRTQESARWTGSNSKTTSLSSLGSQRSDRSPLLLSPSAHSHYGGQKMTSMHTHLNISGVGGAGAGAGAGDGSGVGVGVGAFSRWSTSHLSSSPSISQRGYFWRGSPANASFNSTGHGGHKSAIRSSMRQPYMGWRSQEKLSQRTPHERLASSLLGQQQRTLPASHATSCTAVTANGGSGDKQQQPITPEIQTSIKEVTSAIVHYVNDQTKQQQCSRSTSPNSRKCWRESSFVGIRPLDSPQTPIIENTIFSTLTQKKTHSSSNNENKSNISAVDKRSSTAYLNSTTFASTLLQQQQQQQQQQHQQHSSSGGNGVLLARLNNGDVDSNASSGVSPGESISYSEC